MIENFFILIFLVDFSDPQNPRGGEIIFGRISFFLKYIIKV